MSQYRQEWEESVRFWNQAYAPSEDDEKQLREQYGPEDWARLAPSPKQVAAIQTLSGSKRLLDYGCGHGWASVIAAKCGCQNVVAVDVAENCVPQVRLYADVFGVARQINVRSIEPRWLSQQESASFDALFTSNVLDVVPEEVCDDILKEASRVLCPGAKAIVSLNFYAPMKDDPERNIAVKEGKYLFVNGILRLFLLSDEGWKEKFEKHGLRVERLEHYAWPGEAKETRRLFYLRKE